jgi:hypothetical protein
LLLKDGFRALRFLSVNCNFQLLRLQFHRGLLGGILSKSEFVPITPHYELKVLESLRLLTVKLLCTLLAAHPLQGLSQALPL